MNEICKLIWINLTELKTKWASVVVSVKVVMTFVCENFVGETVKNYILKLQYLVHRKFSIHNEINFFNAKADADIGVILFHEA